MKYEGAHYYYMLPNCLLNILPICTPIAVSENANTDYYLSVSVEIWEKREWYLIDALVFFYFPTDED